MKNDHSSFIGLQKYPLKLGFRKTNAVQAHDVMLLGQADLLPIS